MLSKKIILIVLAGWMPTMVTAQQNINSDLKTLIQKSIAYFPKLKETEIGLQAGKEKLEIAKSAYYPNIMLNAGYNYIDPVSSVSFPVAPGVTKAMQFQPYNNYTATAGFTYPVIDFGRAWFFVRKSNEELEQSKLNIELNKAQLAAQVASVYYSMAYFSKAVAIEDTVLLAMHSYQNVIISRLRNGDALILDSITTGSAISEEENRKLSLQNLLSKQIALLQYTTNETSIVMPEKFDFPQWYLESDTTNQVQSSFEYKIISSKLKAQQFDIKMNRSNLFPVVSVNAGLGYRNGYQPDIEKLVFGTQAGLSISAPIFYGNKARNSIKLSKLYLKQLQQSQENVSHSFRKDISNVRSDISTLEAQIVNSNRQVLQSRSAVELAQSRYRNGLVTYTDVLNALANRQRAELSKLNLEYQLCLARIELARITGVAYYE
ncbi:MAG: TolC family protein [Bacteroidetes bacterium]|nr:TolC family protein [Bacteroidota bacterium]MCC7513984.1 TolC family protein [Bacteroidia bacterium]HCI58386.1 hypothetical protein [Bacteroidota bacterium]HRH83888.1 TolC family protein [Bacteroidia bacterium]